jgi:hypothetical protein
MSGFPLRTPTDAERYMKQYMANLDLRAKLDNDNYQANKLFLRTGQQPTEMTDYRSVTEKLADTERLKLDVKRRLQEVTDGTQASDIVQNLTKNDIVFLSQNIDNIIADIKRMFKVGVLTDQFLNYFRRYQDKFIQTAGVEFGLQESTGRELLSTNKEILKQMPKNSDLDNISNMIDDLSLENKAVGRSILSNVEDLKATNNFIADVVEKVSMSDNIITKAEIQEILSSIVSDLPSSADINNVLSKIETMSQYGDNRQIEALTNKLNTLTTPQPEIMDKLEIIQTLVNNLGVKQQSNYIPPEELNKKTKKEIEVYITSDNRILEILNNIGYNKTTLSQLNKANLIAVLRENDEEIRNTLLPTGAIAETVPVAQSVAMPAFTPMAQAMAQAEDEKTIEEENPEMFQGSGMFRRRQGRPKKMIGGSIAITKRRSYEVTPDMIDYNAGIISAPKYVPIGRYIINRQLLNDDIVSIKRKCGTGINGHPNTRVSKNLGCVLRKILGNGLPSFEEFAGLNEDEKNYLHKIAKTTKIDDRLNIPAPNKSENDKDIREFEVLRGQIIAGNDNTELIKKFKVILMKLSSKDLIPKAQVKDILLDLTTMGY